MVKSRRAASSRQSSVKATTARRPKVSTSRRKVVTSNGRPSATTVTVPCSIPVGTALSPAASASADTLSGRASVAMSMSATGRPMQRVAHAAADEERPVPAGRQRRGDRAGRRRLQPVAGDAGHGSCIRSEKVFSIRAVAPQM